MKTKNILSGFYFLEDIIPFIKWILKQIVNFFSFLNTFISSFYLLEDIIPLIKKTFKFVIKIIVSAYFFCLSVGSFIANSKYFIKQKKAEKERVKVTNGINVEKYANVSRILHEKKYGLKNTDYNALRINWNLFAEAMKQRFSNSNANNQIKKYKVKSIRSTYSYDLNKRIIY